MDHKEILVSVLGESWRDTVEDVWSDKREVVKDRPMPTGIPRLDVALGGGLPSAITEISGEESVGKTLVLGHIIKAAQERGQRVGLCSTEHLDLPYYEIIGVNLSNLVIFPLSATMDRLINTMVEFLRGGNSLLALDSVSAMQYDGTFFDWFDRADRMFEMANCVIRPGSAFVAVSQVRQAKSVEPGKMFREGTESASRRLVDRFTTKVVLSREDVKEDSYTLVAVVESSIFSAPGAAVDFYVEKGKPIDVYRDIIVAGKEIGAIQVRGSTYYFYEAPIGIGMRQAILEARKNPDMVNAILDKAFQTCGI